jgi:lysozyme
MPSSTALMTLAALAAFVLLRSANATQDSRYSGVITPADDPAPAPIEPLTSTNVEWDTEGPIGDLTMDKPNRLSDAGREIIKAREGGFIATPYPDHKGYSIGYGHLMRADETYQSITQDKADELFNADVGWAEKAVFNSVLAPITQAQFDALVSFCFNVGRSAFVNSTLLRRLNAGDSIANIGHEFSRWVFASGKVNDGLVMRREAEYQQFMA